MGFQSLFLAFLCFITAVHAGQLTVQLPRLTVFGSDGDQLRSEAISLTKRAYPVTLGPNDKLKLTFQVAEEGTDKGVQPHQTFLRFFDSTTGEESIQPVRVSPSGKAKFELNMAKPLSALPPSGAAPLHVSLILGSFVHKPASLDLFALHIPPSAPAPVHADEVLYHPRPEIMHTFRADQKLPLRPVSALFTALCLAPWAALFVLWGAVRPGIPHLFSPSILFFVLSITLIEGLLFWYWIELRLGQILLYGSGAATLALLTGKQALAGIAERRTRSG